MEVKPHIHIIQLPTIADYRGKLSFMEVEKPLPFNIGNVYCIYPNDAQENKSPLLLGSEEKVIIALTGSIEILASTTGNSKQYSTFESDKGLYIPTDLSVTSFNLSTEAICLVVMARGSSLAQVSHCSPLLTSYSLSDCSLIDFPLHNEAKEKLAYTNNLPFSIERLFYIHTIPTATHRGMHAHTSCHEILIATSGSIEVELNDGCTQKTILLNNPKVGLHIPPGIWATQRYKTQNASCLVLASNLYDEEGYIHSYSQFEKYKSNGN